MNWKNVTVKLGDLQPWEHNPRTMSKTQAKRLIKSWQTLGQFQTIAIGPACEVYDGHQRLNALLAAYGAAYEVEARQSERALNDDERAALMLAANIPAGAWDWQALAQWDAEAVKDWGMDAETLATWNSDAANLATMLQADETTDNDAEPQIDRAAELNEKWKVNTGDLWRIGEHRLLCGDSTKREDVDRVMMGEKARMVFTDPPYNVAYQDNESIESLKARNRRTDGLTVSNDSMTDSEFDSFLIAFMELFPIDAGGSFYLCAPPGRPETQFRNAIDCISGLTLRECIVWVKDVFVFGRQDYHWRHESILYGWRDGAAHYFVDDHTQDTVWEFDRPHDSKEHPTMKPLELPVKAISNSSRRDEVVFDCFAGSGTTIVACQNLQRKCRAIEISPNYCAVILERMATAFPDIVIERIEA
jgi:DNA modification methylase